MNKSSKCKNCQWYGKPYWSIINPCDSCPNENNYKTIITIDGEPVIEKTLTEEEIKKAMTDKSIFQITLEEKDKEIERLTAESTEWESKCYKYQDIINELEKWLEDYIKLFNRPDMLEEQTLEDLKEVLDKLKALKEGKE